MRFTVLGTSISSAALALKMANEAHVESQQQLVRSNRLLRLAEIELTKAKEEAEKLIEKDSPEPFHKIGNRYIAERDVKATIDNAVRAATEELIAKLAALDAPKKGQS